MLHDDFGDYPLVLPQSGLIPAGGKLEGKRTLKVVGDYILAIFDRYFKDQTGRLLDGLVSVYPEVGFERR